jgi:glycosyltransferase involved in cell wall biosynthesis
MLEIVCFTGQSGLTDYSVSMARQMRGKCRLITASSLPERFRCAGFDVVFAFRRSRHYPIDIMRFAVGALKRRPNWMLWQGPLKFPLVDGVIARTLRARGIRCAVTVHDVLPHYPKPWSRWTFSFYYRSFERLIVHSQSAKEEIQRLGVRNPILVVPHGLYDIFYIERPSQVKARQLIGGLIGTSRGVVVLLFGHIELRKGIFEFLETADLLKDDKRFLFLVAGNSELSVKEEKLVKEMASAAGNVVLKMERIPFEAVERYFCAADIVALPYREGTTSGVLKLAIAFDRPVVASNVGDFPEQVCERNGICIPLGADFVERYSEAVRKIGNDPTVWAQRSMEFKRELQWEGIVARIESFLEGTNKVSAFDD